MATNTPFTKLDFDDIKSNLKTFLKSQSRFADYDFEGSNMSVLLDVLAYNTFQNNYYTNMAVSEMFLDSAQLRENIISHAKELNYLPQSRTSSQSLLSVKLDATDNPTSVLIPRKTKFIAQCGNKTYTFYTDESVTVTPQTTGLYTTTDLRVYEGRYLTEMYNVTGEDGEAFVINNENVDVSSIRVYVRENSSAAATRTEYNKASTLFGVASDDEVYYVEPHFDNNYQITFGQNAFGTQPSIGNVIEIEYRTCLADEPNGATGFTILDRISGYTATVIDATVAEGGTERETNQSIKKFAPKSIQIQDRAVTEDDYKVLMMNQYPEIQAIAVYGGETVSPPQYGRVIVSVDVAGADGVSRNDKDKYTTFLKQRTPIGIEPIVVSPQFMYLAVDTTVYYNTKNVTVSGADIRNQVSTTISSFNENNLSDFGATLRYTKFAAAIDDTNVSIVSNDTEVLAIIDVVPTLNQVASYSIDFGNELVINQPASDDELMHHYRAAIKSSNFTYNGDQAFIQDNGNGVLQVLSTNASGTQYLNRNIGSVDYATGEISITNLTVENYTGTAVKIYARTEIPDITAPHSRILSIRDADVSVTTVGVRA